MFLLKFAALEVATFKNNRVQASDGAHHAIEVVFKSLRTSAGASSPSSSAPPSAGVSSPSYSAPGVSASSSSAPTASAVPLPTIEIDPLPCTEEHVLEVYKSCVLGGKAAQDAVENEVMATEANIDDHAG